MRYSTKVIGTARMAGVAAVFALAAACGGQAKVASPPPSGAPAPASVPSSVPKPQFNPPPGAVRLPAAKVDGAALPKEFPKEVYADKGGTVLVVRAEEGGCGHALGNAVEQTAQRVVVDLSETKAKPGQMCTMDLRHPVISVPLSAPVGDRVVVLKHSPPR